MIFLWSCRSSNYVSASNVFQFGALQSITDTLIYLKGQRKQAYYITVNPIHNSQIKAAEKFYWFVLLKLRFSWVNMNANSTAKDFWTMKSLVLS